MSAAFKPNEGMYHYPPTTTVLPPPPPQTKNARVPYTFSGIFALIMTFLMIFWCTRYQGGYSWGSLYYMLQQWNWHATLTMFGFSIFFAESILVFRINKKYSRRMSVITHVIMNFIGLVLTTIGLAAMFSLNTSFKFDRFFSLHSWIGLTTYILFIGQFACGMFTHLIPILPKSLSSYHSYCGIAIYVLSVVSVGTGIMLKAALTANANYVRLDSEAYVINFMGLCFTLFSALVLYIVIHPQYK